MCLLLRLRAQARAAVLGSFPFDVHSTVEDNGKLAEDVNPGARQLWDDLESLRDSDNGSTLLEALGGGLRLIFENPSAPEREERAKDARDLLKGLNLG